MKEKAKDVSIYKKPAFWIILIALILCVALAVFLMTDPFSKEEIPTEQSAVVDGEYTFPSARELCEYLTQNRENDARIKALFERQEAAGLEDLPVIYLPAKLPEGYTRGVIRFTTYGKYISFHYEKPDGKQLAFVWGFLDDGTELLKTRIESFSLEMIDGLDGVWANEAMDDTGTSIYSAYFEADGYSFQINVPKENLAALCEGGRIPVKTVSYVSLSSQSTSSTESVNQTDLTALREKYPEYFNLDTTKGLEVYVWQMAKGNYSFGLLPGTNREKTAEELWNLKSTSAEEMRAILSTYLLDEEMIAVIPWQNPISSYLVPELVIRSDEPSEAAQDRRNGYIEMIRKMLFGNE